MPLACRLLRSEGLLRTIIHGPRQALLTGFWALGILVPTNYLEIFPELFYGTARFISELLLFQKSTVYLDPFTPRSPEIQIMGSRSKNRSAPGVRSQARHKPGEVSISATSLALAAQQLADARDRMSASYYATGTNPDPVYGEEFVKGWQSAMKVVQSALNGNIKVSFDKLPSVHSLPLGD